jgi:hypothetical protein
MTLSDLEQYLMKIGLRTDDLTVAGQSYLVITGVRIPRGSHEGQLCEVAVRRTSDNPWLPEAKLHVRPHLAPTGQRNTLQSPLGTEWQYLSRRFDRAPTARSFFAHILTVLGEM